MLLSGLPLPLLFPVSAPVSAPLLCRSSSSSSISSEDTSVSTDSNTSVGSSDSVRSDTGAGVSKNANANANASTDGPSRRTRRRFTSVQLMMLEQLYHQKSHPTREQREALAAQVNADTRSVTVWFQNKRQTERKALHSATNLHTTVPFPTSGTTSSTHAGPLGTPFTTRPAARPRALTHNIGIMNRSATGPPLRPSTVRRPSLDHVATRSERAHPPRTPHRSRSLASSSSSPPCPITPSSTRGGTHEIWESMPSSPLVPSSPGEGEKVGAYGVAERARERALLDFEGRTGRVKRRRTLEWACAAARLQTVARGRSRSCSGEQNTSERGNNGDSLFLDRGEDDRGDGLDELVLDLGDTEPEDETEVRTPVAPQRPRRAVVSLQVGGFTEDSKKRRKMEKQNIAPLNPNAVMGACVMDKEEIVIERDVVKETFDEDMMDAALVLCGLGKRA